jgi:putative ABC transport system permease protein
MVFAMRSHQALFSEKLALCPLIEAIALSLLGGLIGTILGVAVAFFFASYSGWQFTLSGLAIPLGAGTATVVGLFFGSYPAARAAQLDPIVALRGE